MRPRFQADEDLNRKIVVGLRRRELGVDIRDAHQAGIIGLPDTEVLHQAAAADRILVSHDRRTMLAHFERLLRSASSPGLILVAQDLDVGAAIDDLLLIWTATEAAEWYNQVGFLPL